MKQKIQRVLHKIQKASWWILHKAACGFGYLLPDGTVQTWWFFYIVAALWISQLSDKETEVWKKALEMKKDMSKSERERFAAECVEALPKHKRRM